MKTLSSEENEEGEEEVREEGISNQARIKTDPGSHGWRYQRCLSSTLS